MNKNRSLWHRFYIPLGILLLAIGFLLLARHILFPDNFNWPTWVQTVGSIAAVLVAIWVSVDQASQQRWRDAEHERKDVAGTLRSILSEVQASLIYMDSQVAPALRTQPGEPIRVTFAIPDQPFPIFDALIPKLGIIQSAALQTQIIQAYAYAKSLAMTAQEHAKMVDNFSGAEWALVKEGSKNALIERDRTRAALLSYDEMLRTSYAEAREKFETLISTLTTMNVTE